VWARRAGPGGGRYPRRVDPVLSVVTPAHNERGNVAPLVDQILEALRPLGEPFEVIIVDDGSTDGTRRAIRDLMPTTPELRCVATDRCPPGRGNGQSAAFYAGLRAARGGLVATLDADLQNDPADIPRLLAELRRTGADMAQGDRSAARAKGDAAIRRYASLVGRAFRRVLLGDTIRDTGCSLRVMRRELALRLPLEFKGAHRFIPVTARQMGYAVVELPVGHRPRTSGQTKYGMGISKRAIPGLIDCLAIRWMGARRTPIDWVDVRADNAAHADSTENAQGPRASAPEVAGADR